MPEKLNLKRLEKKALSEPLTLDFEKSDLPNSQKNAEILDDLTT